MKVLRCVSGTEGKLDGLVRARSEPVRQSRSERQELLLGDVHECVVRYLNLADGVSYELFLVDASQSTE